MPASLSCLPDSPSLHTHQAYSGPLHFASPAIISPKALSLLSWTSSTEKRISWSLPTAALESFLSQHVSTLLYRGYIVSTGTFKPYQRAVASFLSCSSLKFSRLFTQFYSHLECELQKPALNFIQHCIPRNRTCESAGLTAGISSVSVEGTKAGKSSHCSRVFWSYKDRLDFWKEIVQKAESTTKEENAEKKRVWLSSPIKRGLLKAWLCLYPHESHR